VQAIAQAEETEETAVLEGPAGNPEEATLPDAAAPQRVSAAQDGGAPVSAPVAMAVAVVVIFAIACAAPFLAGFQNIMGIIIIGIGLYEAWKLNRRATLTISGPHVLAAAPAAAAQA
jgi:hypothetical protein